MTILETKNITKNFGGIHAVNDLSIGVEEGKVTGIIGPNGSGKTTLINLLSGMLQIDQGFIVISGSVKVKKVKSYMIADYGITRTFQDVRLFNQMTALDNILVVLTERNFWSALLEQHKDYHIDRAKDILKELDLWDKRGELAINLSYGQRKLLEIGRALAMKSDVYLLDEPFAGLFPEMRKIVSGIIKKLRDENKAVVLIEHNMDIIRELSDYVFVMDEGKLLAEGDPNEVLDKKEVIEAYLGE